MSGQGWRVSARISSKQKRRLPAGHHPAGRAGRNLDPLPSGGVVTVARTKPPTAVRRLRKAQLAARDGQHCAYCRRPFATLAEATIDHVVPYALWRTWSATALCLACRDCNERKANRLPLSLALVLLRWSQPDRPTLTPTLWPLLARLATTLRPTIAADSIGQQSAPYVPESTPLHPIALERTAA
jgi:5-methylcytosine-specific restriction endonuclease McrA